MYCIWFNGAANFYLSDAISGLDCQVSEPKAKPEVLPSSREGKGGTGTTSW